MHQLGPPRSIRQPLRRLEGEDFLVLILLQSALWIGVSKLVRYLPVWLGPAWTLSFASVYLPLAGLLLSVWLFWGRSIRLRLEHRWPLPWKLTESVIKFLTHSLPEAIFEFFQRKTGARSPSFRYPLTLTFPASLKDKAHANRIARMRWEGDTPSLFADLEWHFRNPNTMAIVRDGMGIAVGYFDFAPVTPDYLALLRAGSLNEYDLADYMLPDDSGCASLRAASVIYVAGLASIRPESPWEEIQIGAFLHWSLARLLMKCVFAPDDDREVTFVAAAFGPGEKFCERAGMRKTGDVRIVGDPTKKPYPVFELTLTLRAAIATSARLRQVLDDEYPRGLSVNTMSSTPTRQVYTLDRRARRRARETAANDA